MKCLNITVFGRVQGVYFRRNTLLKAQELGIKGFVRNEENGTVYIEAEGEEDILEQFVEWCFIGPEHAEVKNMEMKEGKLKNYADFTRQ